MAGPAQEELCALAAIFCGPGEWEVLSHSELGNMYVNFNQGPDRHTLERPSEQTDIVWGLRIMLVLEAAVGFWGVDVNDDFTDGAVLRILTEAEGPAEDAAVPLELVFHLPAGYPSCPPGVSVSSERLTRAQCGAVRERLLEHAQSLLPEPMVHQLVLWLQQHLRHILTEAGAGGGPGQCPSAASATEDEGLWLTLLHVDHMRAKSRYARAVRQWAAGLGLTGRLMLMGRVILILLQGRRDDIKEYLVLQKTCRVDVDSSGKKCKEKMVSVLYESRVQPEHARFAAFDVREFSRLDALREEFETAGLQELFSEFVLGLVK